MPSDDINLESVSNDDSQSKTTTVVNGQCDQPITVREAQPVQGVNVDLRNNQAPILDQPIGIKAPTVTHQGVNNNGSSNQHNQTIAAQAVANANINPVHLSDVLAAPASISLQKERYLQALHEQAVHGLRVLDTQARQQKDYLTKQGEQLKRDVTAKIELEVKKQQQELDRMGTQEITRIKTKLQEQKSALEREAAELTIEFQEKCASLDLSRKHREMADAECMFETKIRGEIDRLERIRILESREQNQINKNNIGLFRG